MTSEKQSILIKILNIDRRILWIIVIALLVWPLLRPIGLPIVVDKLTHDYYDVIESLPPGSVVLASIDIEAGLWGEIGPQCITTAQHLFNKEGIKFIEVCFYRADGQIVFETMTLPKVDQRDKEYGVDWVNVGYIEGKEPAMALFAADFLYPGKDAYGNSLEDLPLFKEVKSMDDCDLYIDIASGDWKEGIRQFSVPYDVPCIAGTIALGVPDLYPYIDAGIIVGGLGGLTGAAQYEYLLKKPGLAIKGMDAISVSHIFLLSLIFFTNIVYIIMRSRGETR